jgi:hypothetical protein
VVIPINQPEVNLNHPNHACLMNYLFLPFYPSHKKKSPEDNQLSPGEGVSGQNDHVHKERDRKHKMQREMYEKSVGSK